MINLANLKNPFPCPIYSKKFIPPPTPFSILCVKKIIKIIFIFPRLMF